MVELYSPRSEMELLMLRSILEDAGLRYFVRNDTFGSLYMSPYVEAYNRKTLYVPAHELDEAAALLGEFFQRTGDPPPAPPEEPPGLFGRLLVRLAGWLGERPDASRPSLRVIRNERPLPPPRRARERPPLRLIRS